MHRLGFPPSLPSLENVYAISDLEREDYHAWPPCLTWGKGVHLHWGGGGPDVVIFCKLLKEGLWWFVYSKKNNILPLGGEERGLPGQEVRGFHSHMLERGSIWVNGNHGQHRTSVRCRDEKACVPTVDNCRKLKWKYQIYTNKHWQNLQNWFN